MYSWYIYIWKHTNLRLGVGHLHTVYKQWTRLYNPPNCSSTIICQVHHCSIFSWDCYCCYPYVPQHSNYVLILSISASPIVIPVIPFDPHDISHEDTWQVHYYGMAYDSHSLHWYIYICIVPVILPIYIVQWLFIGLVWGNVKTEIPPNNGNNNVVSCGFSFTPIQWITRYGIPMI